MSIINIEFYNTPEGDVIIKEMGKPPSILKENHRITIEYMLSVILGRYPKAHARLAKIYSSSALNTWHYEFRIVSRFIRCNFGDYDQCTFDINKDGLFVFEEVKCPLRGDCEHEGVICRPELHTPLTGRETEILKLIASHYKTDDIARLLSISPRTVNRHRENLKAKIKVKNVGEIISYCNTNNLI